MLCCVKITEIVFDARHPAAIARFWAALLDGFEVRAYDDEEIARLATLGLTPETDTNVMVDGTSHNIGFQQTETAGPGGAAKNKVHLDLGSTNRAADVDRAIQLGATVVESYDDHTWLRDPDGNDFCIIDPH